MAALDAVKNLETTKNPRRFTRQNSTNGRVSQLTTMEHQVNATNDGSGMKFQAGGMAGDTGARMAAGRL